MADERRLGKENSRRCRILFLKEYSIFVSIGGKK